MISPSLIILIEAFRSIFPSLTKHPAIAPIRGMRKVFLTSAFPMVFIFFNPANGFSVFHYSYLHILITLAAGKNIASAVEGWTTFSLENLITSDPDMIILGDYPWVSPEDVIAREGWGTLRAVQSGSIYPINVDLVSRPGPRIFDGLEELAKIIHPELFE